MVSLLEDSDGDEGACVDFGDRYPENGLLVLIR